MNSQENSQVSALYVSAFFDELIACGLEDVVISPGSRSTPLALIAYESDLQVHVDVDERGAAFFALGLAKASGRPVCALCTSGTAVANYYPAVLEAESSRVPLIFLTGDRPPRLQNLGAPQTCDQLNVFGHHVRHFQNMPLPSIDMAHIAFARQMALTAFSHAVGGQVSTDDYGNLWYGCMSDAGPVHVNFPFEEPLLPDVKAEGLFTCGRTRDVCHGGICDNAPTNPLHLALSHPEASTIAAVRECMRTKRSLVLCGEGTCVSQAEARMLIEWAQVYNLPLLADPLSGLRSFDEALIIDNYDSLFADERYSDIDLIVRFGRYPVSKACFTSLAKIRPIQIVVDVCETRDFNAMTDMFIRVSPAAFVASFMHDDLRGEKNKECCSRQSSFAQTWIEGNVAIARRIASVREVEKGFEGAFVYRLMDLVPEDSCVFSASSLSIRMVDTFYCKQDKDVRLLCNRGLNGIDGTLSSALGASLCFEQSTLLIGDLALLHDINALSLQAEFSELYGQDGPAIIIVLLNNEGGGIFDLLPQRSTDPYFSRLFLTPQMLDFSQLARGFGVAHQRVETVTEFDFAYRRFLGRPGIHLIEVVLSTDGLKERYGMFLS